MIKVLTAKKHRNLLNQIADLQSKVDQLSGKGIPKEWKTKTKECFELNGHTYFEFKNWTELPYYRGIELENAMTMLNMGVDKDILLKFIEQMEDAYDKGSPMKLAEQVSKLKGRINTVVVPDLLNHISAIVYFRDDEDPEYLDNELIEQKKAEFAKNTYLQDFFLLRTYRKLYKASKQSDTLLLTRLKQLNQTIKRDLSP